MLAVLFSQEAQKLCSFLQIMPKIMPAQSVGAFDCFKRKEHYYVFSAGGSQSLMLAHVSKRA